MTLLGTAPARLTSMAGCLKRLGLLLSISLLIPNTVQSEIQHLRFDTSRTSWELGYDSGHVRIDRHQRDGFEFHTGAAAEAIQFSATTGASAGRSYLRLTQAVKTSLVNDDLTAAVWMRSNRGGAVLAVRVTLPQEIDPQTGQPVAFDLHGEKYQTPGRWQQLKCQTREGLVEDQLKLIRRRLASTLRDRPLNSQIATVAQVVLKVPVESGATELLLDDLTFGPIVRADDTPVSEVDLVGHSNGNRPSSPVRIETSRLLVNDEPFFPRIAPYHGETIDTLNECGISVAWVERYDDQILIDALAQRGIWSMATPPPAAVGEGGVVQAAGLMPIPATTAPILFWTVGTRLPPQDLRRVEAWIDQLRDADRAFSSPRPVLADVIGDERRFSRYVSLVGSSRHTLHTGVSPLQYHNYLDHRQKLALPDRFKWTWIQTEPADGNVVTRSASQHLPVLVEAEQIWMQAWSAISVGHKALGYWTSSSLDDQTPAAEERRLALAILNAQIDLLEPWLATGKVVDTVPVSLQRRQSPVQGRSAYSFRNSIASPRERDALPAENARDVSSYAHRELQAAVVESDYGRLVIPLWYGDGAQFQPGQMGAEDVSLLVRGLVDARAWQVTTTGVTPVEMRRVAGGMQVTLPTIDQYAFVVITADPGLEEDLIQRMTSMRRRCGKLWAELAAAKLLRVRETHAAIEATSAPRVPDGAFLLTAAGNMLDQARRQLQSEQYANAERSSRQSMQLLRKLQRSHWENATKSLTSPTSSPHTVCFNTLPNHWQLISTIGRSGDAIDGNLLRSGTFEDLDTMAIDGWQQMRTAVADPQRKIAELHPDAASGQLCLRLRSSGAGDGALPQHIGPDVVVVSPQVTVQGGQILLVSGRVRVDRIAEGEIDGLMVYDNVMGTVGALRWQNPSPNRQWESFELIREVPSLRDVQLTFELHGEGDVRLDDVKIVALGNTLPVDGTSPATSRSGIGRNLLDFAPDFPRVKLWPGRKSVEQSPEAVQPAL